MRASREKRCLTLSAGVDFRRLGDENYSDIMLVPLFVKGPGQAEGAVSDRSVTTIDIVPTIADILSIDMPYEIDGRSLIDVEAPDDGTKTLVDSRLSGAREGEPQASRRVTVDDAIEESYVAWEHKLDTFGTGDRYGLYSIGSDPGLIGRSVATYLSSERSPLVLTLSGLEAFASVDTSSASLPLHVAGRIDGEASTSNRVAVAVNDRIAAITGPYLEDGTGAFSTMIPEEFLVPGSNTIEALVLDEHQGSLRLRRGSLR